MPHIKAEMKREKAARMEITALFTDVEIAQEIGISVSALGAMKRTPEYQEIITSLKTGILPSMDAAIAEDVEKIKQRIRDNVPAALNTIIDCVQQRYDRKLALQASETLLEIDGRFTKVTRVGLPTQDQGGIGTSKNEDDMASALLSALSKRAQVEKKFEDVSSDNSPIN